MNSYEYKKEIESTAKGIVEEALKDYSKEVVERDDIEERIQELLDEVVNGHEYISYTEYHYDVMKHSGNEESLEEEFGLQYAASIIEEEGFDGLVKARAFWAMYYDVQEEIGNILDDAMEEHNEKIIIKTLCGWYVRSGRGIEQC